jgi:hypothetical protein
MRKTNKRKSFTAYLPEVVIDKVNDLATSLDCLPSNVIEASLIAVLDAPPADVIEYLNEVDVEGGIEKISKKIYKLDNKK